MEVGAIVYAVRVTADGAVEALRDVGEGFERIDMVARKSGQGASQGTDQMSKGANDAAIAYTALAAAGAKAFQTIIGWVGQGISAAKEYQSAVLGLQSIASGRGIGAEEMQQGLDRLVDSFFDTEAAAASLKNLLSRGYTMDQAITTITRLKDAAAFGRQANLSLSDAVKTATEGLKNENSILVDNAGVTKNVAKMWQDYAKALGVTTESLTQAQKIEAEYQGILQETELQVGDLEKASGTLMGTQAELDKATKDTSIAFGEAMAPAVQLVQGVLTGFMELVGGIASELPGLTAGVTTAGIAFVGLFVITKVQEGFAKFLSIVPAIQAGFTAIGVSANLAVPIVGALLAAITVGVGAFTSWKNAQAAAVQAAREELDNLQGSISAQEEQIASLRALSDEYDALAKKESTTSAEKTRMQEIEKTLATEHDIVSVAAANQAEKYAELSAQLRETLGLKNEELEMDQRQAIALAHAQVKVPTHFGNLKQELEDAKDNLSDLEEAWERGDELHQYQMDALNTGLPALIKDLNAQIVEEAKSPEVYNAYSETIDLMLSNIVDELSKTEGIDEASVSMAEAMYKSIAKVRPDSAAAFWFADQFLEAAKESLTTDKFLEGFDFSLVGEEMKDQIGAYKPQIESAFRDLIESLPHNGYDIAPFDDIQLDHFIELLIYGQTEAKSLSEAMAAASSAMSDSSSVVRDLDAIRNQYQDAGAEQKVSLEEQYALQQELLGIETGRLTQQLLDLQAIDQTNLSREEQIQLALQMLALDGQIASSEEQMGMAIDANTQAIQESGDELTRIKDAMDLKKEQRDLYNGWLQAARAVKDGTMATQEQKRTVDTLMKSFAAKDIDDLEEKLSTLTDGAQEGLEALDGELGAFIQSQRAEMSKLQNEMFFSPDVDNTKAIAAIQATITEAIFLRNALAGIVIGSGGQLGDGGGGGGGGGGSKKDPAEEAKKAAEEAARAQQQAYDDALAAIERKKRLNEISTQEEIDLLLEVQRMHAQTTQQQMDMEEKLYEARKRMQQEWFDRQLSDMDHLSTLAHMTSAEQLDLLLGELTAAAATEEQQREINERIHQQRTQMYQEMIDGAQRVLDRQRQLGGITVQEEIARLEQMLSMYAYTAEQKMALEDQIFSAQMQLRSQEVSEVDRLNNGVIQALRNRYQEMRDLEMQQLKDSAESWKEWSNETVAAIRAQIEALNDAAQEEDRDGEDRKYQRKLAERQQALLYETDDYNRLQIEKEIARMEEERAKVLAKRARDDEKARLQAEITAVQDAANQEQENIRKQQDALADTYNQLMKSESLRAEAERLMLTADQESILDLISRYAPDYEATGKSFGERMLSGLTSAMEGGITTWMTNLQDRLQGMIDQMATESLAAADQFYASRQATQAAQAAAAAQSQSVYIEQPITITSPVESPAEYARRIKRIDEELAQKILSS